jgi:hypothetical protein
LGTLSIEAGSTASSESKGECLPADPSKTTPKGFALCFPGWTRIPEAAARESAAGRTGVARPFPAGAIAAAPRGRAAARRGRGV